jgi:7-cyano-7-deazaguanine synthase
MKKNNKKGVILLSGGLDSAVTLYYARSRGFRPDALIFDYAQRHKKEIEYAIKLCRLNHIDFYTAKIDLGWTKSSLTDSKIVVPLSRNLNKKDIPATYVAGRNIIFLSYAFSLAESIGAETIFIGAHTCDYSGYPDCRPEFLWNFNQAVNLGMKDSKIKISAPLIDKSKKDIIKLGLKLKVPFRYTWSCYSGGKKPCLQCDSCRFRTEAFRRLNIIDPLLRK